MTCGRIFVALALLFALTGIPSSTWAAPSGDRGGGPNITFPDTLLMQNGGPVINIKQPQETWMHAAKGDGATDDTAAFQDVWDLLKREYKAHGPWTSANNFYVYLPRGTYKVSDTLIYRGPTVGAYPKWDGTFDINHVHFVGQDRARTIIKLADRCPGYQDPANPKIVLAFQHPDTVFNNVPGGNWLRNLTIDTGRGNPGAAALFFQGANNTDLHDIAIRSDDGQGRYGIWFKQGSIQGYYADVTVQGFQDGICATVNGEGDVAFEYLTLRGQTDAGILLTGGGLSLRRLRSDEAAGVPALKIDGSGPQAVVLDSDLHGAGMSGPAIEMTRDAEQCLFARDVATEGYDAAIRKAGADVVSGKLVDEYVSYPAATLPPGQPARSLRLPIEDTPPVPWYDPATQWAIVDDYPSVQAALDSGKPVVCFKKRQYQLTGDVAVPASVKVVNGMAASVNGGVFIINQPSPSPILFQDSNMPVRVKAQRDVIQRCATGIISNPNGLPITFYLENVNDNTSGDDFCRPGQRVFARQIDIEYGGGNQIVCNGGALWIFGYKTENMKATPFTAQNGGSLEILGGYCNQTAAPPPALQNPLLRNDGGRVSATLFTNLGGPFVRAVDETRGGVTTTIPNTEFPHRGSVYRSDYVIPLYVGDTRPAPAPSPAFPGAEGFGAGATGGQGGSVYHVANLNDTGPGSFRDAVSAGPRTVVFDVGGVIALKSPVTVHGDLTISGQTAPREGVTLAGQELSFAGARNVIVRYLRVRQGLTGRRGESAINTHGGSDIIFDHVSVAWGRWDTVDMNGCSDITFQNCLIGPGINPQRFGCLCQGDGITFSHCLWIDNQSRNPKAKGRVQFINNVVYNWGVTGFVGGHSGAAHEADLINNNFIKGPSSDDHFVGEFKNTDQVFQSGNWVDLNRDGKFDGRPVVPADFGSGPDAPTLAAAPFLHPAIPVTVDPAARAYAQIVAGVGDSLSRDDVDKQLIDQLTSLGTRGKTIEDPAEMSGKD